jgi:ribosomal protein S18 acetylase RimI-like enzyme
MNKKRESEIKIIKFRNEDAQKLAELLNSFDREGLWPWVFTGGVPFTAERVLSSFPAGVKNICVLISTYEGKFTGICSLHPHAEDPGAAYIGLFGVHPDFLGKKHGKTLILKAIQTAADSGYKRVDLNTWAGNMRAVPLYKKSGMFWVPETSVYMQDYVPGIITFPLAQAFFKQHEWYSSQVRKLELVPDEFELERMEVYPYEFAEGKDRLKVWADRYGRSILGIERVLGDELLRVVCRLEDHTVVAGVEHKFAIEIVNGTGNRVQGSVFLSGFDGLDLNSTPPESFKAEKGESLRLEAKFVVRPDTEIPDVSRRQKTIKASLILNGELIPFEVGVRVVPLLEFKTFPETLVGAPGTVGTIQVNLFNNSKEHFKGRVSVIDENNRLSVGDTAIPVSIPSKSHSGFSIDVRIPEDQPTSSIPLQLFAKGEVKGASVETRTETIFFKCLKPGGIISSIEKREQEKVVVVETEDLTAQVQLRGALLSITCKSGSRGRQDVMLRGGFGVGPPFGFARPVDFEHEILKRPESVELVLSGLHPDKPGIKMIRSLTFYAGTSLIKDQVKIINMHPVISYDISVRISGWDAGRSMFTMVVPLEGIVEHEMISFPSSEADLPTDPNDYRESWVCFQSKGQGFCYGQIWSKEKLAKIRFTEQTLFAPEYSLGDVKPGQTACTSELYHVVGAGDWQTIRRKWQSLVERKTRFEERLTGPKPLFNIQLTKDAFYDTAILKTQLQVINSRNKEETGKILLVPPKGWRVVPSQLKVAGATAKKPFLADVSLYPPAGSEPGVHSGSIEFHTDRQFRQFPLDVALLSGTPGRSVSIQRKREQGKEVVKVSNGLLEFKACAEFAGCLYFLSGEDKVNHLCSSFPRIGTKVFLQNYSGGIRSLYSGEDLNFEKSKSHLESLRTEIIKEERWSGVRFSFKSERQEELKGILGSTSYLTLPSSNIVKIGREFSNPTRARFEFANCIWISPEVGGDFQKNELVFPRDGRIFRFKTAADLWVSGVQPEKGWAFVANEKKKTGLGVIAGDPRNSLILSIAIRKSLMELFIESRIRLQPKEKVKVDDYIVLCDCDYRSVDRLSDALRRETFCEGTDKRLERSWQS